MGSNSFEPLTLTVREHTRRLPVKNKKTMRIADSESSFEPLAAGETTGFENTTPPTLRRGKSGLEKAADWLPGAGGMAGGIVGGIGGTVAGFGVGGVPGAIGGAGVGGAGGEALRQLIYDLDPSQIPTDNLAAPKAIAQSGAEQAVAELLGQGAAPVLKGAAHLGMGVAARFTPEVAQTAVREGIAFTRGGLRKLEGKLTDVAAKTERLVATMQGRGGRFNTRQFAQGVYDKALAEIKKNSSWATDGSLEKLNKLKEAFDYQPANLSATELHTFVKSARKIAEPTIVRSVEGGAAASVADPVTQVWKRFEWEDGRDLLNTANPMYGVLNGKYAELARVREVIAPTRFDPATGVEVARKVVSHGATVTKAALAGAGGGAAAHGDNMLGGLIGALIAGGVASPQVMSLIAKGLASRGLAETGRQVPRLLMQAAHE